MPLKSEYIALFPGFHPEIKREERDRMCFFPPPKEKLRLSSF